MHQGDDAAAIPPARPARKGLITVVVSMVVILVVIVGVAVYGWRSAQPSAPAPAAAGAAALPVTPYEAATVVLQAQAAALLRGDEQGWMAAVDPGQPGLQDRYLGLYRSLRALDIRMFDYHVYPRQSKETEPNSVAVLGSVSYCFSVDTCRPKKGIAKRESDSPIVTQALTLTSVQGRYVITYLGRDTMPRDLQPTPWQDGDLVFAEGKRVTVGAPRTEAGHLAEVVALADKAALVNDRFAGYVGNAQPRYRVYLADAEGWRSWYRREPGKSATAYAIPLNRTGADVILKISELDQPGALLTTLQHELGHVTTLSGSRPTDDEDLWLAEGIAEYIGWFPRGATASSHRDAVRAAVNGSRRPKSIVAEPLPDNASAQTIGTFYGLAHFAVDCMADRFGERKLFDFARLSLREGETYDWASRKAFGRPFAAVDTSCVAWTRQHA